MAFFSNASNIIAKPFVLYDDYVPEVLSGRAKEQLEIHHRLSPAVKRQKPFHCWLFGPSGSGKTTLARSVVTTLARQHGLNWAYVNCWTNPSYHAVLDELCHQFKVLGAEPRSIAHKLNKLRAAIGQEIALVILDEIDRVPLRERNDLLYAFSEANNIGMVVVSYRRGTSLDLDHRVRSRLRPELIQLKSYFRADIATILRSRAAEGLLPDVCEDTVLTKIARSVEGNARIAVQVLREAAYLAERSGAERLEYQHVSEVWKRVEQENLAYRLRSLTEHHRLLFEIIKKQPGIVSAELWEAYLRSCADNAWEPVASRTFHGYINTLLRVGMLKYRPVAKTARTRAFWAAVDEDVEKESSHPS